MESSIQAGNMQPSDLTQPQTSVRARRRRRIRPRNWEDRVTGCSHCQQGPVRRAHRETVFEFLYSTLGFYPFVCRNCLNRTFRSHRSHTILATALFLLLAGFSALGLRHSWPRHPRPTPPRPEIARPAKVGDSLNNEDVLQLARAGLSTESMVRLIRHKSHNFRIDTESLAQIKRVGAADEVIYAMVDVTLADQLNNEDVVKLTRAGLSTDSLVRLIRHKSHKFRIDTEALTQIKQAGATDQVIYTMVDVALADQP